MEKWRTNATFIATISFAIAVRNFMPKTLAMGGLIFRML